MADISMCANNVTCRLRDVCYRSPLSGTTPSEFRQSWIYYRPDLDELCHGFWPMKDYEPQPSASQEPRDE